MLLRVSPVNSLAHHQWFLGTYFFGLTSVLWWRGAHICSNGKKKHTKLGFWCAPEDRCSLSSAGVEVCPDPWFWADILPVSHHLSSWGPTWPPHIPFPNLTQVRPVPIELLPHRLASLRSWCSQQGEGQVSSYTWEACSTRSSASCLPPLLLTELTACLVTAPGFEWTSLASASPFVFLFLLDVLAILTVELGAWL